MEQKFLTQQAVSKARTLALAVFDIDGVVRDVAVSYLRALADTVEHFTGSAYRPTLAAIDLLKSEGLWNNDWEAAQELIYRFFESKGQPRPAVNLNYDALVAFFQGRYRGTHPQELTGYIQDEPLLLSASYLTSLTQAGIPWGFFSGATRLSASYVLETRLGLESPVLVAMEDAPSKPNPTGLLTAVAQLEAYEAITSKLPVLYVGDTVADLYTVQRVKALDASRTWIGVGVLPPHAQNSTDYAADLYSAGAAVVLANVEQLTPAQIMTLILTK